MGIRHTHAAHRHTDKIPIHIKKNLKSKETNAGAWRDGLSGGATSHMVHTCHVNTQEAEAGSLHQCEFKASPLYTLSSSQDYTRRHCLNFFLFVFKKQ